MVKYFTILLILSLTSIIVIAQKEDRNWCFGYEAGINFNDLTNPIPFATLCNNIEANASISDSNGNLLFYLTSTGDVDHGPFSILDANHSIIPNGDNIWAYSSCTNGIVIVPSGDKYYVFYISSLKGGQFICPQFNSCNYLFLSIVSRSSGNLEVIRKNQLISSERLSEKVAAVRHANGKDWWIITREYKNLSCSNRFITYLSTSTGILGPFTQNIGRVSCNLGFESGEMAISPDGNKLAVVSQSYVNGNLYGLLELFDFDRCTGIFTDSLLLENATNLYPYGVAFSNDASKLYLSEGKVLTTSHLWQYNLLNLSKQLLWTDTSSNILRGQLELGPDKKLYLSMAYGSWSSLPYNQYSQNLGVINHPDSLGAACDFQPYTFYLGDSSRTYGGLPNMPNYNLNPISIYQADAGKDTITLCSDSINSVVLGVPQVEHILYSWSPSRGLSDTTIAQPIASPTKDLMYYLTITDTSNTTSCNMRVDSVFVIVEVCATGVSVVGSQHTVVRVYPNPVSKVLSAECIVPGGCEGYELRLYDVLGRNVLMREFTDESIQVDVSGLENGIYFYNIQSTDPPSFSMSKGMTGKIVVQ